MLEGSRAFAFGEHRLLTPTLELGVRHDGGDAETGSGVDLGGTLRYADNRLGLSVDASGRLLVAHEDENYREWGASLAIRLDPGTAGRGLSLDVAPSWGAAATGGAERLWSLNNARGLAPGYGPAARMRLNAGVAYGLPAFRGRGSMAPYAGMRVSGPGRDWRAGVRWRRSDAVSFGVEATRGEATGAPPAHRILLQASVRL